MNKREVMEKIAKKVEVCKKCRLCETAQNAVPGEGNVNAKIVFIGEAPGANEDKIGRPFVGRAGKLLDSLLKEIELERKDVWIGNIIKHRPPKNRDPLQDEIAACGPYLTVQLKIIKPKLVVTLGRFAMYYFYKGGKISRDHGNLIKTEKGLYVYPVYHPAAGLRNERFRAALENDFKRIPQILKEIELDDIRIKLSSAKEDEKGQMKLNL